MLAVSPQQWLTVQMTQRGIHARLILRAPGGAVIRLVDRWLAPALGGQLGLSLRNEPAGAYELTVQRVDEDSTAGAYDIRISEQTSSAARAAREDAVRVLRHDTVQAVTAWLRQSAVPLSSTRPGSGFEDLNRFRRALNGVRVLGLGESTHGTRDFFQFKHRMLEYLAQHMGFTILALEASPPLALRINEYVLGGPGDVTALVRGLRQWPSGTEEVRDLVLWMRQYNTTAAPERKLRFYGFDNTFPPRSAKVVDRFLRAHAAGYSARATRLLQSAGLDSAGFLQRVEGGTPSPDADEQVQRDLLEVIGYLSAHRAGLVQASSQQEYGETLNAARGLLQYEKWRALRNEHDDNVRDRHMAHSVSDILDANPGARVVLWGHNDHLARFDLRGPNTLVPMGQVLAQELGTEYYAVCVAFNRGGFQAMNEYPQYPALSPGAGLTAFTVPPAPEGTLEWFLAKAGYPQYLVDVRGSRRTAIIDSWLAGSLPIRHVGATYFHSGDEVESTAGRASISRSCDGVFFVDQTARARPLPKNTSMGHFNP